MMRCEGVGGADEVEMGLGTLGERGRAVGGWRWPIADYRLEVAGRRSPVAGRRVPVAGCRLRVAGCHSPVACRRQQPGRREVISGQRHAI
ncbi:hypothetical protein C6T65_15710 [Burkholderia vietnamiensis]|uniref:Uncharacterized protein n=1 Tax=Burkholderia vietnamiensis TaxID=60552 RepID=A0AA44Y506_BURVI|nr:hypothetical protein C6T65_15710 [Burkholderia vietnamiensis]